MPAKIERERYFRELSYVELSGLFAGPMKPSTLAHWADVAALGAIGVVAPFPLTHRKPPAGAKLWPYDTSTGDYRDSEASRALIAPLREAIVALRAGCAVFRSPESFSPSAANRDALVKFFAELATPEALGVDLVWIPGGLWNVRTAVKLAGELGVTCAFDPLVRDPSEPPEIHYDLEVASLYLRIEGAHSGAIRTERLEDLAMLIEHYETLPTTVVFASAERWKDARNLKKLLAAD